MLKINRFTLATLFLILSLCVSLVNTQPVFADDSTPPTETPVVVDETPTEEPVVESTPTEEPVVESTPTEEPAETPAPDEAETPDETEEGISEEESITNLLEEIPENTSVVVLNEQGETVPLVSQEAAEIVLEEDPMWCPEGVLPGGTGCTINYSSIALLMTQLNNNSANYAQNGVIYFTSGDTGASFSLTSGNAFNAMRNYNLTLQGGWNGTNGAGATFTGQSAFGSSSLTLGSSGARWGGNITISNFTFSGNSSTAVTVYTSDGDITLNNVDVSQQTGNNTALLNTTNGDILVQNGSSFDSNNSNFGGGQNGNGFSATSTNGSITITGTSANRITFQDARGSGNSTNYNGATLSAPVITLNYVTSEDNDASGILATNFNVLTLNNVIASDNGTDISGQGASNDIGSGVTANGNANSRIIVIGGTFSDNQRYGIESSNATVYIRSNPTTCSDNGYDTSCYSVSSPVSDNTPPVVNATITGTSGSNGWYTSNVTVSWTATDAQSGIFSGCAPTTLTTDTASTVVACTATNNAGLSTTQSVTIRIDKTAPTLNLPANIITGPTSPSGAVVPFSVTVTDGLSGPGTVSCNPASGATFPVNTTTTVNCSGTDAAGNSASGSFTVTVQDGPPTLNLPADITANATSAAGASVTYTASATDDVDGTISVACNPASGSTFQLGDTIVNCSATDSANNTVTGSFTITVVDNIAPALSLPSNIIEEATSAAGAAVTFTVSATDAIDGSVSAGCSHNSGDTFPFGDTIVNCSATDNSNNTTNGSFTVTVRDTTPPAFDSQSDVNVVTTDPTGAVVNYATTTSDAVDGAGVASCAPASGSMFSVGSTLVTCSATDTNGNSASMSFNVNVTYTSPGGGGGGGGGTTPGGGGTTPGGGGTTPGGGGTTPTIPGTGGGSSSGGSGLSFSNPGTAGFIPVTGTAYTFDITCPPASFKQLYQDFTLYFNNLCGYQGTAELLTTSTLPAPLDGQTLISAFSLNTLKGGKPAEKLPIGAEIIIEFNIPAADLDADLQILFWDGKKWVELEGKLKGTVYEATVDHTGVFALVKK